MGSWEPFLFTLWRVATWGHAPRASWVRDADLTCECSFGCGLLPPGDFYLGMVTSGDGCVLNSVTVGGRLDVPPLQGDAVVCLGDAAEISGRIQACLGEEGALVLRTPGTRREGVLDSSR